MKYTGWTRINRHIVFVENGKCAWATNEKGWHQDIMSVDGSVINGKYSESTLRKMVKDGKAIFK